MNKKKFVVLAIMMVALLVLTSAFLVACNKDETPAQEDTPSSETETIEPTEGLLIANSDFKVIGTSVTDYPRTINSWTGAKSFNADYASSVVAGAISLEQALYEASASKWQDENKTLFDKLKAGGRYGDEDTIKHALMIYMPTEGADLGDEDAIYGPTAYGYTSSSFTIEAHSYYKLSVDVLTYNIAGDTTNENNVPGARIYVSSSTFAEFEAIDTNGEWETYEIYIEGAASSTSLTLMLALGKYTTNYKDGLTTGYAFFDNVVLEKLETKDEVEPSAQFAGAVQQEVANYGQENDRVHTTTLTVPNGRFEYGTTTPSTTSVPSTWSFVTGNSSKDDPAPTSLGRNAIIDVTKFETEHSNYSSTYYLKSNADDEPRTYVPATDDLNAIETLITNLPAGTVGTNVYMLSQQLMTASGIKSSRSITFEKNKTYALSINVLTCSVHGAGVSLILSGSDGEDIVIKGISSSSSNDVLIGKAPIDPDNHSYISGSDVEGASTLGWTTYTFYVTGNQYKDYSYTMTIWLGTEGTNSNNAVAYTYYSSSSSSSNSTTYRANGTFSNGWLFVDELKLKEIDEADIPAVNVEDSGSYTLDCSLQPKVDYRGLRVNLGTENLFDETGNSLTIAKTTAGASLEGNGTTQAGIPNGWVSNYDTTEATNPIITGGVITDGLVRIDTEEQFTQSGGLGTYPNTPYEIQSPYAYMIYASKDTYYEIESEPFTVEANGFYRLSFWVKTADDVKKTSGIYVYLLDEDDNTVSSFTKINTEDFNDYTNDWCELTFLIRGSKEEAENMRLKFTLGTGDRWAVSTLTSGAVYVCNMNLATISYSSFSSATTGTYVKSVDRTSSTTYTFTNGSFDEYNLEDELLDPTKALKEQTVLAQPTSWTISSSTLDANKDGSSLVAGVFALENVANNIYFDHSTQTSAVFTNIDSSKFDAFYGAETPAAVIENFDKIWGPNVLAIASTDATKYALGYSSSKFTLSSNNIYAISVLVKGIGADRASVYLSGEAATDGDGATFKIENPAEDWTTYTFYINVGSTSISLNLNLWLGYNTKYVSVENEGDEKSAGAVFFDGIVKKSVSQEDFDAVVENATTKKIDFMTDSFDSLSSTVESRKSLNSPTGWTGSAETDQSSANSKYGVIYSDTQFLPEPNAVDGTDYVSILGKEYTIDDDVTVTAEETEDLTPEEIEELKQAKLEALQKANWLPVSALPEAHSGKNMLVINNMSASAFTYSSSTYTFSANTYYEVSVYVRTYGLKAKLDNNGAEVEDDNIGAYIELYLGSANEEGNPLSFTKVQSNDEWTCYTFYVKTLKSSVSSVKLKLSLGSVVKNDDVTTGLTSGYAFFDDVTVKKSTQEAYDLAAADELANTEVRTVKEEESGNPDEEDTDTTPETKKFNLEYLWWMIPTIILAVLIIVVVVVFFAKKIRKPSRRAASTSSKEAISKKHTRYDDNKE